MQLSTTGWWILGLVGFAAVAFIVLFVGADMNRPNGSKMPSVLQIMALPFVPLVFLFIWTYEHIGGVVRICRDWRDRHNRHNRRDG